MNRLTRRRLTETLALADELGELSYEALRKRFSGLGEALRRRQVSREDVVAEALAIAREMGKRVSGLFAYETQVTGALVLATGAIAELATGEGKTLVAALAACVSALDGRGVHVATVNSYLAERDHEFCEPIAKALGLTCGLVPERGENEPKRAAYACDITYGVGYEFGFDYLRDQLSRMRTPQLGATQRLCELMLEESVSAPEVVQRPLAYAIVDEVDSVLIDEAGSPLVISEPTTIENEVANPYQIAHAVAESLVEDIDFRLKPSRRCPNLTPSGLHRIHEEPEIPWEELRRPWQNYVSNALAAIHGFDRDVHYVIREEKVVIIDEFTGRAHEERSWNGGLHQAVNAKEQLPIQPEMESAASITRQRYFALYEQISGLTGTATESADELKEFFDLAVIQVPLHRPGRRDVLPDRVFSSSAAAHEAILEEIRERHATGQPILVGTRTIRTCEAIANRLAEAEIEHRLLTAKEDEEENAIIAGAGQPGSILIATNMAGRGTHIGLTDKALKAGGLHVIAVERNESIRVDRQLIGRAARQGQPGSAQFFISADDTMAEPFADGWRKYEGELPDSKAAAEKILRAQAKIEKLAYRMRRDSAKRDKWIDETRNVLA